MRAREISKEKGAERNNMDLARRSEQQKLARKGE
jgi:hypothetical protein